ALGPDDWAPRIDLQDKFLVGRETSNSYGKTMRSQQPDPHPRPAGLRRIASVRKDVAEDGPRSERPCRLAFRIPLIRGSGGRWQIHRRRLQLESWRYCTASSPSGSVY